METFQSLVQSFQGLGLCRGDMLMLHSAFKSIGGVEGGPALVIDALLHILGSEGTLIVPTFTFAFCKGQPFHIKDTPSEMGAISEMVRMRTDSTRILHPIYSCALVGTKSKVLGQIRYQSSFGPQSIFAQLREHDAKIMILGRTPNNPHCEEYPLTFFHHVEEMIGVDYRFLKEFKGMITDEVGLTYRGTCTMLVRDLDKGVITAVDPMGKVLEEKGVVQKGWVGQASTKLMKARDVFEITALTMKTSPFKLYQLKTT